MPQPFQTPVGLANPHLQTICSSIIRKPFLQRKLKPFLNAAEVQRVEVAGVTLQVELNFLPRAPLVLLIPGWLGSANSSYVQSAAAQLHAAGFSVARINLRDHGNTAHLNQGLFHSALIEEVIELVGHFQSLNQAPTGLIGFSLGGNFALRVASALPDIMTLAIAPAVKPAETMHAIDSNLIYQRYFVQKWRRVWQQKQRAFPDLYNFEAAMRIGTVSALTDYFVARHAPEFGSTKNYFNAYDLSGTRLAETRARIVLANDDPIIPTRHFRDLPESLAIEIHPHGGHNAFLKNWRLESWIDDYATGFFAPLLD